MNTCLLVVRGRNKHRDICVYIPDYADNKNVYREFVFNI